jgi:hypothetical protein
VDKQSIISAVECMYNGNIRSVIRDGVKLFADMNHPDKIAWTGHYKIWQALRAYQDEQRKKGEIIRVENYIQGQRLTRLIPGLAYRPDGSVFFTFYGGRFTNFRWRPGKGPKGMSPTQMSETSEKGGSNG